jgi:ribonuclease HI
MTQEQTNETTVESNDGYTTGMVIYCDGGARPNPGNIGWGNHGFIYSTQEPKKGSGNLTHILTASGYIPKTEKLTPGAFSEVTPISYLDIFGSSNVIATNNVAEILAMTNALQMAIDHNVSKITIYTDSEYVRRALEEWHHEWVKRNWIRRDGSPVPNAEQFKVLVDTLNLAKSKNIEVHPHWVKAHVGILGNTIADKMATVGCMYSMRGVIRTDKKVSPAQGYWKSDSIRNPLISHKRVIFSTDETANVKGLYLCTDSSREENMMGKRTPDGCYGVVMLNTPDPVIEKLREHHFNIACGANTFILARLDKLFSADVFQDIAEYGDIVFIRNNNHRFDIDYIDKTPISKELMPLKLAARAIEELSFIVGLMPVVTEEKETPNVYIQDITDLLYEKESKKGKKDAEDTFKLKSEFGVGSTKTEATFTTPNGNQAKIGLNFGIDLPHRNSLKKLEEFNPVVKLIVYREGISSLRYLTSVTTKEGVGIYGSLYTNLFFDKS